MSKKIRLALLIPALLLSIAAPASAETSGSPEGDFTVQRHRGTQCWNPVYGSDANFCITVNIHDAYEWKEALVYTTGTDVAGWSVSNLRLIRDGFVVQSVGYHYDQGTGSYSTGWDQTCGCGHTWYSEAFDILLQHDSGPEPYRGSFASGYYSS